MSGWQNSFQPVAASGVSGTWQSSFQPNSYTKNVGNDWSNAENKIGQIWANKDLNPASTGVQILGTAASGAYAPAGEALRSGYNALPSEVTQPINQAANTAIQSVKDAYNSGIDKLSSTDSGKTIGDYLMNSPHIQNGMQEISDDGKALANILTLSEVAKPALGNASMAAGDALYDSGKAAQQAVKEKFIQDLVRPKETPTVQADNALRTIQVDGKNVYQPSPSELQMAKTISDIPGVGNHLTPQGNLSAIVKANAEEAQALQARLQKTNVPVDLGEIQNGINQSMQKLADSPHVTGDGNAVKMNVVKGMNKAILNNVGANGEITAAGLLQARKDFDAALPPRVFNSPTDTAFTETAKEMRGMVNRIIAKADPSADVMKSLKKQSDLFDAADNIAPKAAGEAATALGRAMHRISPHNLTTAIGGAGVGAGALAASHYLSISPAMIGAVLAPVGVWKGLKAPTTRVLLGKALGGG